MDDQSLILVKKHISGGRLAINIEPSEFYMFIETHHDSTQKVSDDNLMEFVNTIENEIKDGVFATGTSQALEMWNTREKIADAYVKEGVVFIYCI